MRPNRPISSPSLSLSLSFHPSLNANDGAAKDTARIITERPAHPFSTQSWMSSEGPPLVAISPLEGLAVPEGAMEENTRVGKVL